LGRAYFILFPFPLTRLSDRNLQVLSSPAAVVVVLFLLPLLFLLLLVRVPRPPLPSRALGGYLLLTTFSSSLSSLSSSTGAFFFSLFPAFLPCPCFLPSPPDDAVLLALIFPFLFVSPALDFDFALDVAFRLRRLSAFFSRRSSVSVSSADVYYARM